MGAFCCDFRDHHRICGQPGLPYRLLHVGAQHAGADAGDPLCLHIVHGGGDTRALGHRCHPLLRHGRPMLLPYFPPPADNPTHEMK
eukprot:scaffold603298_cov52-Prasinocladus_malaysianus.AAC.1